MIARCKARATTFLKGGECDRACLLFRNGLLSHQLGNELGYSRARSDFPFSDRVNHFHPQTLLLHPVVGVVIDVVLNCIGERALVAVIYTKVQDWHPFVVTSNRVWCLPYIDLTGTLFGCMYLPGNGFHAVINFQISNPPMDPHEFVSALVCMLARSAKPVIEDGEEWVD